MQGDRVSGHQSAHACRSTAPRKAGAIPWPGSLAMQWPWLRLAPARWTATAGMLLSPMKQVKLLAFSGQCWYGVDTGYELKPLQQQQALLDFKRMHFKSIMSC